ncbi:unnamed protein product [Schistosoma rodhaini]|uniref:Histone-lysine N-methyltransferase n=1 Tax=Schistosoma rodhaini TaxID=6188 RepID=A0AA85G3A4_9TREM|nr:unnamed protein product [Schistosoma rodhaini]CAH8595889.1 unnamed protein product [Schistosoma rodhaini]
MNVLKHEHRVLIDELTESIYDALDSDDIFDVIFAFVESKYQAELKDVNNPKLRLHIIQQRFSLALEECGLIDEIIESFPELNLNARLDKLKKEQSTLQSNILELNGKIDTIVDEMTRLQINSFGRVLRLFDNRVIDLAKDEEEIVVIERPNNRIPESTINHSCAPVWRTLQPAELLLGLQLTPSQPVLYRKTQHTWFPGRVLSCHLPNSDPSTPKSDKDRAKENENAQYTIALDTSSKSKSEICFAVTSSLALAFSASELRQKYPVGARVVCIYYSLMMVIRNIHHRTKSIAYATNVSLQSIRFRISIAKENWKEATESSQEFIKRYLAQYPQRPMVRLKPGQTVETELDGDWMKATVEKVDASLALMKFSRTHSEWIYRGSTRLEPLFSDLLSSQSKSVPTHNQRVEVEYSSVDVPLDSSAKRRKARKSATGNQNTAMSVRALSSGDSHKISNSIHQTNKSLSNYNNEALKTTSKKGSEKNINEQCLSIDPITNLSELESTGTKTSYLDNLFKEFDHKPFESHKCGHHCLKSYRKPSSALSPILCSENPVDYKGLNPLEIPFHCGWLRYLAKYDPPVNNKCNIIYSAPCGRSLRSMHEVERFLDKTNSQLTADLFSFDSTLIINQEFRAEKTLTNIVDLSYGKENVPIPCVNSVDNEVPGYIDYTPQRQPIGNVPLLKDSKFLVCCDCTDNCRDRTKCACQQLTVEASSLTNPNGLVDSQAGYRYRRLSQFTVGGVYECNSNCQCDRRCSNRVVQQGLWVKLQVFKTARKGWGIRALNAIPKGTFICTYAGAIYDEAMAVQEGFDCGDEYQAELDYIETVEKDKEGYESTVEDLNEILNETTVALSDTKKFSDENKTSHISAVTDQQVLSSRSNSTTTSNNTPIDNDKDESESDNRRNTSSATSPVSESTAIDVDENDDVDNNYDDKTSRSSEISSNSSSRNALISTKPLLLNRNYDSSESCLNTDNDLTQISVRIKKKKHKREEKKRQKKGISLPPVYSELTENTTSKISDKYIQNISSMLNTKEIPNDIMNDSPERPRTKHNSPLPYISSDLEETSDLITYPDVQCEDTSQVIPSSVDLCSEMLDPSNLSHVVYSEPGKNENNSADNTISSIQSQSKNPKVNIIFNGNNNEQIASIRSRCTVQDVIQEISETIIQTKTSLKKPETIELSNISNQLSHPSLNHTPSSVLVSKTQKKMKKFEMSKHYKPMKPKVQVNLYPVVEKEDTSTPHFHSMFNKISKYSNQVKLKNKSKRSRSKSSSTNSSTNELYNRKSEYKKIWSNRAASLPRSFRLLHNAKQLLRESDFSRIPVVRLCPLENDIKQEDHDIEMKNGIMNSDDAKSSNDDSKPKFEFPVEVKEDVKNEQCGGSTNTGDSKKDLNILKVGTLENDSQSETIGDTLKVTSISANSPSPKHQGSLKLRLRRVSSTSSFKAVRPYLPPISKEISKSGKSLSEIDEKNNRVGRELRRRDKIQRSASLEPEIKDRKPLERSKSHRKDSEKQHRRQHHHHHHHHRNHRQQQLQQQSQSHQQNQQQTKRMYPVAQKDWLRARTYFNDINPYIMDAKKMGNLGRYFNHSCNPNVFVQNVFIDTHDPRFPEVAFFAKRNIDVGEEMTWDYGYTVDAVPFKVLYCYCGEPNCRIRLL